MEPFNLDDAALEDCGGPPEVGLRDAPFAGDGLAGAVVDIAPGKLGWPYHWEAAQEEWLLVLEGRPTLRTPDGETELERGDLVVFPVGPDGAHGVRNATDAPVRLLMLCNRAATNVVVYPDSGKVLARTPWQESVHRLDDRVGYW